jgi:hypothetical protein
MGRVNNICMYVIVAIGVKDFEGLKNPRPK